MGTRWQCAATAIGGLFQNKNAFDMIRKDTLFTNVGLTANNEPWWEGIGKGEAAIDWLGKPFGFPYFDQAKLSLAFALRLGVGLGQRAGGIGELSGLYRRQTLPKGHRQSCREGVPSAGGVHRLHLEGRDMQGA